MDKLKILVVDDNELARTAIGNHLGSHSVEYAGDLETAAGKLKTKHYDICFIDLKLGRGDEYSGLKLIPLAVSKGIYSVVMSGHDTEDLINKAHDLGCKDFYAKGTEKTSIENVISKYFQQRTEIDTNLVFSRQFVTEDPATRAGIAEALKYASMDIPILILGPSGTGKTKLAEVIHEHSGREGGFISINCSAHPEDLLEAELFGYKKGAFTGAFENRKGKLLQAHEGTIFLDEIGSMSLNMQAKLLKAIEERTFYPVGSDKRESSEFRVISATLEDPKKLLAAKRLRFDFFQRVLGFTVNLRPLAQRRCDIFPLIHFFARGGKRLSFTSEAKSFLFKHSWPGNTRELKKLVDMLVSGHDGRVTLEQVQKHIALEVREAGLRSFATEEQYQYALQNGLDNFVKNLVSEIILRNLDENGGRKRKTLSDLRISWRRLYSTIRKNSDLLQPHQKEEELH